MDEFKISSYLKQQFTILEKDVNALFGKKARQMKLGMSKFPQETKG